MTDTVIDKPELFSELRQKVRLKIAPPGPYRMCAELLPGTPFAPLYGHDGILSKIINCDGRDIYPFREGPQEPRHVWEHRWVDGRGGRGTRGVCYFIGGAEGPIKIGFTVDLKGRLANLRASSPVWLEALATRSGGEARERVYHGQFDEHRLHGEWFTRHPDILAEIDRLNQNGPECAYATHPALTTRWEASHGIR